LFIKRADWSLLFLGRLCSFGPSRNFVFLDQWQGDFVHFINDFVIGQIGSLEYHGTLIVVECESDAWLGTVGQKVVFKGCFGGCSFDVFISQLLHKLTVRMGIWMQWIDFEVDSFDGLQIYR
jgi:hypothetical protein